VEGRANNHTQSPGAGRGANLISDTVGRKGGKLKYWRGGRKTCTHIEGLCRGRHYILDGIWGAGNGHSSVSGGEENLESRGTSEVKSYHRSP